MNNNHPDSGEHAVPNPGHTLFEFVRHWSRRTNAPLSKTIGQNGRYALVVEAVDSVARRGLATINAVGDEIGIDQSGASRLVKEAALAGYLEINPTPSDGRQRPVILSKAGRTLLAAAHSWQENIFEQLTLGWDHEEQRAFHRAMLRLMDRSREIGI